MHDRIRDDLCHKVDELLTDHLGTLVVDSVFYMLEVSDMTYMQKLSVIDGAIAFGKWQMTQSDLRELLAIRSEFVLGEL